MRIDHLPYDADEIKDNRWYHEHYWKERALKLLLAHSGNPNGLCLLDYGCGRGEFLAMATAAGFEPSGVDMDPHCVEIAQRHGKATQLAAEDYLASIPSASVDVVSCFHVLEHVENPKRLLAAMRRVSRCFVLLAVPNLRSFQHLNQRQQMLVNNGHLQGWDRATLRNLAEIHCGLELVAFTTDMTILPSVSSRISRLFGPGAAKGFNLKILSRLWPERCTSIIALFKVPECP